MCVWPRLFGQKRAWYEFCMHGMMRFYHKEAPGFKMWIFARVNMPFLVLFMTCIFIMQSQMDSLFSWHSVFPNSLIWIVHTLFSHCHVICKPLCCCFFPVEHKRRILEECSRCSFLYNESSLWPCQAQKSTNDLALVMLNIT